LAWLSCGWLVLYGLVYCTKEWSSMTEGELPWRGRQSKRLSPLRSWVRFLLQTHVKRVCQRSAESCGFSPGTPVSCHWPTEKIGRVG
jgi:hypothetical protein